jgi:hypothetical protein
MQSEEFDNKIREAADHHHPAYDEKAWVNMEKLLDKHLPQEKDDRRRFIFFLLFFLLLGGGAWLLISKPWNGSKRVAQAQQSVQTLQQNAPAATDPVTTTDKGGRATQPVIDLTNKNAGNEKSSASDAPLSEQNNDVAGTVFSKKERRTSTTTATTTTSGNKKKDRSQTVSVIDNKVKLDKDNIDKGVQDEKPVTSVKTNTTNPGADANPADKNNKPVPGNNNLSVVSNTNQKVTEPVNKESVNKETASKEPENKEVVNKDTLAAVQEPVVKKAKSKSKKTNSFFFTLSSGPDASFAGTGNLGKMKLLAGIGIGYTLKDRLTIRTGFYTGRKIYSALPGEYHPPSSFWTYYPNLEKVDANCKVYEIPLSLSYNFGNSSKHKWFTSAGLSSYLMKKETYNYFYKVTPASPTISKEWTLLDQNKHYFSVLTLSGGYQRNISKTISVVVEPYFKLPLSGVGYGKIKLNSAGILFSVGIKPFNARKNRDKPSH